MTITLCKSYLKCRYLFLKYSHNLIAFLKQKGDPSVY